jgi:hypothetical protein
MLDLHDYRAGLERDVVPPRLGTLVGVATARRRVRRSGIAAIAAATAVAAALVLAPKGRPDATPPAVTSSAVGVQAWTASDVVNHPNAENALAVSSDPLFLATSTTPDDTHSLRRWWRCLDRDHCVHPVPVQARTAIEVRDGASGRHLVVLMPATETWAVGGELSLEQLVRYVGSGQWYLSQPIATGAAPVLLSADEATPTSLTLTDGVVAPRAGQRAVWCGAWFGQDGPLGAMCLLDPRALTLTRIDLPGGVEWSPSTVEGYRGTRVGEVVEQLPDGTFRSSRPGDGVVTLVMPLVLPRGTLAVYEWRGDNTLWLRVSTDHGASWRVLEDPNGGRSYDPYQLPWNWNDWPKVNP